MSVICMNKILSILKKTINEDTARRYGVWLVILAGLLVLLPGTGTVPLIDRDEPRFGQATREMMDRQEWVIPYFNGEYRFDKPVMTYWIMRAFYQMGVNELTSRLHSVLFAIATALVIFYWGRKLFGALAGFWGALSFLTCLQIMIHGRSNVADVPMVFAVALSLWAVLELIDREPKTISIWKDKWFWTLYLAQGFGFLTKGPITQAVVILTLLLFRFAFWRKPIMWRNLRVGWGILVILIVVGAWGIPALINTHGLFWNVGIGKHVVARGVDEFNQRSSAFLYYFGSSFISLAPWICFIGYIYRNLRREWTKPKAFLVAWFVSLFVIFTPYATRLPHYIMPGFPAFFMLLGLVLSEFRLMSDEKWARKIYKIISSIYFFLVIFLIASLVIFKVDGFAQTFLLVMVYGGCVLGCLILLMDQTRSSMKISQLAVTLFAFAGALFMLSGSLRSLSPAIQMQDLFADSRKVPSIAYEFREPSLVFYGDRIWQMTTDMDVVKQFALDKPEVFIVVQTAEINVGKFLKEAFFARVAGMPGAVPFYPTAYEPIPELAGLPGLKYVKTVSGFNFAKSKLVVIQVYRRQ